MTEKTSDGGPAFPMVVWQTPDGFCMSYSSKGMTLRDWFAGQALIGFLSSGRGINGGCQTDFTTDRLAKDCATVADAMIKARDGKG